MADLDPPMRWQRSTRCDADHCVEVAFVGDRVLLRSSHHPSGPVITFTGAEWREFCVAVATGDLAEK
jgi:hypothetical protein